jgi:adenine-specific DNA-methyltransferase
LRCVYAVQAEYNGGMNLPGQFIDTDHNGESFFARHAYFAGTGDPYERLKHALRAEINEAAWSALYSTKSCPFNAPQSGKIAVKVINHCGGRSVEGV